MLSRQFPKPGDRLKKVRTNDPQFHGGEVEVRVPEVERRENHISRIDRNQPLLQIALNCLKDNDNERPSAQQLQEQIVALKESTKYVESARPVEEILSEKEQQIREAQERIQSLNEEIESKSELIRAKDQDLLSKNETIKLLEEGKAQLQSQLQQQVLTVSLKDQAIAEKEEAVDILQIEKAQLQTRLEAQQQAHGEIVSRRNQVISANEQVITEKCQLEDELRSTISVKEEVITEKEQLIGALRSTMSVKETMIAKKDQLIRELRSTVSANEEAIAEKDRLIREVRSTVSANEEAIAEKDRLIGEVRKTTVDKEKELLEEIRRKNEAISAMEKSISEKDRQISEFDNERKLFSFNGRNTTKVCTFGKLLGLLRPCSNKWYQIGVNLGLSVEELDSLKKPGLTSEQQLQEMLKLKLMSGEEVTWGDVVIALLGVGEVDLAQQNALLVAGKRSLPGPSALLEAGKSDLAGLGGAGKGSLAQQNALVAGMRSLTGQCALPVAGKSGLIGQSALPGVGKSGLIGQSALPGAGKSGLIGQSALPGAGKSGLIGQSALPGAGKSGLIGQDPFDGAGKGRLAQQNALLGAVEGGLSQQIPQVRQYDKSKQVELEGGLPQEMARAHHDHDRSKRVDYKIQKSKIHGALQQRFKQGDTWYLVDVKWMKQWKKFVGYDQWEQNYVGLEAANPGAVDNSALLQDGTGGTVRDHLMEHLDYFLLPEPTWNMLTSWYGLSSNSRPIARKVVEHGKMYMKYCKVEVYLLKFNLSLHPDLNVTKTRSFSRAETVGDLEAALREEFQVGSDHGCRVWHRFRPTTTYELLSNSSQTLRDAGLYNGQTIVLEMRSKDGSWPRQTIARSTHTAR